MKNLGQRAGKIKTAVGNEKWLQEFSYKYFTKTFSSHLHSAASQYKASRCPDQASSLI